MRLDRFLCEMHTGSRSQVKDWIKKGLVQVDGQIVKKPDCKVDEIKNRITLMGQPLSYQKNVYYVINKPAGVVTSTNDPVSPTVMDLMREVFVSGKPLFPVGRLDKDAEGFLLITNDGELAHRLLAPANHVPKTYLLRLRDPFTDKQEDMLRVGVDIGEKHPCRPAEAERLSEQTIRLTIREGKFHQVKRMLKAVGNEVLFLKRVAFASLWLDEGLDGGEYRPLTEEEISTLKKDAGYDVEE